MPVKHDNEKLRRTMSAIDVYTHNGRETDPLGMYTGRPDIGAVPTLNVNGDNIYLRMEADDIIPVQDADDL